MMVESHDEKKILNGCIALMDEVYQQMVEYMEFMGFEWDEEEKPNFDISYFRIVQRLFLWNTSHSGGTSTIEKCKELGVDWGEYVHFEAEEDCDDG